MTSPDIWRPLVIALVAAITIGLCEQFFRDQVPYGIFRLMSAEVYFRNGQVPWMGLLAAVAASAAMLYAAALNLVRRDF